MCISECRTYLFLSYYPLKQGLKLLLEGISPDASRIFILLSIKTRIETYIGGLGSDKK